MCLIQYRSLRKNVCPRFHLHFTGVSHNKLTFLTLLINLLMNLCFLSVHVLAHCMPALHTTKKKKKKKKKSTYGAQANSSEEMLTSR